MNDRFPPIDFGGQQVEPLNRYAAKAFGWMALGLLTTFLVMMASYMTGAVLVVYTIPALYYILLIAELAVVLILTARINKMSVGGARGLFFVYAVLNGIVFSGLFFMYNVLSMILVFAMTAVYFGVMAAVGYFTKVDLSGLRPILLGGMIFLAAFWILGIFLNLAAFERIVCIIGAGIFLAVTAYDTQKIKTYYQAYSGQPELLAKASIFSALNLYLDFINLFLYILRLVGKRK